MDRRYLGLEMCLVPGDHISDSLSFLKRRLSFGSRADVDVNLSRKDHAW